MSESNKRKADFGNILLTPEIIHSLSIISLTPPAPVSSWYILLLSWTPLLLVYKVR